MSIPSLPKLKQCFEVNQAKSFVVGAFSYLTLLAT
jgi:hypothetical protein